MAATAWDRVRTTRSRRTREGLTLAEVAVIVVLLVVALALLLPAIITVGPPPRVSMCTTNLRQVHVAWLHYAKDYDSWMVCGGNRAGEHDEPPCAPPGNTDPDFPFWYEALAPYLSQEASQAKARRSFRERTGKEPSRDELAEEVARLCGVLACPAKRRAAIGYGYHYAAPFGVSSIYPCTDYPDYSLTWRDRAGDEYDHPVDAEGRPAPVPILWYGQSVRCDVISSPGTQIPFCDAGLVTNDADLKTEPARWRESGASNVTGYVRFPLCEAYTQSAKYGTEKAWRPVPRHGGKVVCVMFDGSARAHPIADIVSYPWGHPRCLFDNRPPYAPSPGAEASRPDPAPGDERGSP